MSQVIGLFWGREYCGPAAGIPLFTMLLMFPLLQQKAHQEGPWLAMHEALYVSTQ
jgi:hypothetical protein